MNKPKLLDLFCGAGGAAMGYHRAGFEVTGVDIKPQSRYPFRFVQSDALRYVCDHWQNYDAIHCSPPCQAYSVTQYMHDNDHPDLLPVTRALLRFIDLPFVIENVPGAPMRNAIFLEGMMFDLGVIRRRYFESNVLLFQPSRIPKNGTTNSHRGYSTGGEYITVAGNNYNREEGARAMGIDWMTTRYELSQSIPPDYTEYIGRQLIRYTSLTKAVV